MSWLYSQALVAEYSEGTCLDGEQFAPLSVMSTRHRFWRNDKMMELSRLFRFGLTLQVLTDIAGEELLTSFLAAFPVKTSQSPEKVPASKEIEAGYGKSLPGLLAKFDPVTHSLKTVQLSLIEDSMSCSPTLPRSGTMRNGCVYQRSSVGLHTGATEFGYLPTPTATEYGSNKSASDGASVRPSLSTMARHSLWPTPNVQNGGRSIKHVKEFSSSGRTAMHNGKKVQIGLEQAVKHWPTPQSRDWKDGTNPKPHGQHSPSLAVRVSQEKQNTGQLNPTWVEWLMGWPLGWTALKPLATDKFQEWQQQHSSCYEPESNTRTCAQKEF